ncbi:hypothetical protein D3C71_1062550 [compost metagenome]
MRVFQVLHIAEHGRLGFDMLMTDHRLNQVFGRCVGVTACPDLGPAQAQAGGKHREEPVAADGFGHDVSQCDQGQGKVVIGGKRAVGILDAHEQRQVTNTAPHPVTGQQSGGHAPQQALEKPVIQTAAKAAVLLQKQQSQNHERKSDSVVQSCLAREPEPHRIIILGVIDLNQRGQDRIGRRQYRPDQQRRPPRQSESEMQQQADADNGQHHHRSRQDERHSPSAITKRRSQLEPADKQ